MQLQNIIYILLGVFILYRIFLRVRRTIGWQQLNPGKMGIMTAIMFIIGMLFLVTGIFHPISLISDVIGILCGVILAYYSASLTRFEQRDGRWFYRPNTWIGSLVTLLFFGRLIYRIYDMSTSAAPGALTATDRLQSMASGWTAGLMLVMFAYYIFYNMILLRKQKHLPQSANR